MSEAKHSPMWRKTATGKLVCYPDGLEAGLLSSNLPDGEKEANERLILAAPDMLEALKIARQYVGANAGRDAIDAAIAKAEGNS